MTLVSSIVTTDVPSTSAYAYCHVFFQLKTFLKAHGWTVKGSSDGTNWSWSGTDHFTDPTKIQATATNKWIVLVSPHATPGDRIELLLYSDTINTIGGIAFGPTGTLTATSTALPAGNTSLTRTLIDSWSETTTRRLHMVCDDANDFEFALIGTKPLDTTYASELIIFQRLALTPPDAVNRYVVFGQTCWIAEVQSGEDTSRLGGSTIMSGSQNVSGNRRAAWGCFSPTSGTPIAAGAVQMQKVVSGSTFGLAVPYGAALGPTSQKTSYPLVLFTMDATPKFLGVGSDFCRWNGQVANLLDSWGPSAGAYNRIALRSINLAWDGTTAPVA